MTTKAIDDMSDEELCLRLLNTDATSPKPDSWEYIVLRVLKMYAADKLGIDMPSSQRLTP